MGKSRSKTSNQSYITQSELVNHFGGKTSQSLAEKKSIFKRLPFDCALCKQAARLFLSDGEP